MGGGLKTGRVGTGWNLAMGGVAVSVADSCRNCPCVRIPTRDRGINGQRTFATGGSGSWQTSTVAPRGAAQPAVRTVSMRNGMMEYRIIKSHRHAQTGSLMQSLEAGYFVCVVIVLDPSPSRATNFSNCSARKIRIGTTR